MKKHVLSLIAVLAFCITGLQAQIPNASFELSRPNGGPANWGRIVLQPFPCTIAEGFDSVYFRVKEPHTGIYALEMRNAHCDESYFAGSAILMLNDTSYFSNSAPFTQRPANISLFYKLLPVGGDIGHVSIQLMDDVNSVMVADAEYDISQATSTYQQQSIPLTYYENTTPTHIAIMFSIINYDGNVNYGTRFLVDDVSALATDIIDIKASKSALVVYPNPSRGPIAIRTAENGPVQLTISNAIGQVVMDAKVATNSLIDMPELSAGLYTYRVVSNNAILGTGKLIRE